MEIKAILLFYLLESQKWGATARKCSSEAALSLRSRRSGTKFAVSLPQKLLIKYQRLPRGFFWNTSLPPLIGWLFYFLKKESYHKLGNISEEIRKNNSRKRQYLYGVRVSQLSKLKGKRKEKI